MHRVDRDQAVAQLHQSAAAYYDSLTAGERAADAAIARASASAARHLIFDHSKSAPRRAQKMRNKRR